MDAGRACVPSDLYQKLAPHSGHSSQLFLNANDGNAQNISNTAWHRVRKSVIRSWAYEDQARPSFSLMAPSTINWDTPNPIPP